MKKLLTLVLVLICVAASAQLVTLQVDTVVVHSGPTADSYGLTGYTTYRLYAVCSTPETKIMSAWGNPDFPGIIATSGQIWNHQFGSFLSNEISEALFTIIPPLEFDSWVTIGCEYSDCDEYSFIVFSWPDESGELGSLSQVFDEGTHSCMGMWHGEGGEWLVAGGNDGYPTAGDDLKILLGQFTTNGDLYGELNFQYYVGEVSEGLPPLLTHLSFGNLAVGCNDPGACNYDANYDPALCPVCSYPGCTDPNACNYDPEAGCDDGLCTTLPGCNDPLACNYDPLALCDGSCIMPGCSDPAACNYDPMAFCGGGSCDFPTTSCTDPLACNYSLTPTCDAECHYEGCTDPNACNYDPEAGCDDGSCIAGVLGCMDSGACNFLPSATCDSGQCTYGVCGCTDMTACNYFALASGDDGSCEGLKGCMNENACNFNPDATCSDNCLMPQCLDPEACNYSTFGCPGGECVYYKYIRFFDDMNTNGTKDFGEGYLSGDVTVLISPINFEASSFNSFSVALPELPDGLYNIQLISYPAEWIPTTATQFGWMGNCGSFMIGFNTGATNDCVVNAMCGNVHCDYETHQVFYYGNYGLELLDLHMVMTHDPLIWPNYWNNDAVLYNDSTVWDIQNFDPGSTISFVQYLIPPGVEYLGQEYSFDYSFTATNGSGEVVCSYNNTYERTYTCPYDPNIKEASPVGYRDEHFILADQEITYTIGFQNTGNAPATDVVVVDTLDVSKLDLSTFNLQFHSHPVSVITHPDGILEFHFLEINLPDSTSDEEGSHGEIIFSLMPRTTVDALDGINNTAHIYFDANPAIVTNTVTHTIFDCAMMSEDFTGISVCEGEDVYLLSTNEYVEDYTWIIEGETVSTSGSLHIESPLPGVYSAILATSNPLCSVENAFSFEVNEIPEITIGINDEGFMEASSGVSFQWYSWDELISGETSSTFPFWKYTFEGYHVFAIVTDENGCADTTNVLHLGGIPENTSLSFSLYPNPMSSTSTLKLPEGTWDIECIDSFGARVGSWSNRSNSVLINRNHLASGLYLLSVTNADGLHTQLKMLVD